MASARISVQDLADRALITAIWKKRLRTRLRKPRLQDFQLGHDPLEYLAFDWELTGVVATLCEELSSGSYRASSPEIVRSAKGRGLTRPLAFLRPRDLLLYKSIVALAENSLLRTSKPWTRFGRGDDDDDKDGGSQAESGWFRNWLRRQGQIWTITKNHSWLIETDVANFFPYVHSASVLDHLLSNSELGEDVIRLLDHMLRQFSPMTEYRVSPVVGLPQEDFDCSRILGHTYLKPVDDEFDEEGRAEQYSRYMDDVVIGADSPDQALRSVHRVQTAFERLGLYPNTAKTRIVPASDFIGDYMKDENDYLGEIEQKLKAGDVDLHQFNARLRRHVRTAPRPKAWNQVLRRYYTLSRHMGSEALLNHAFEHVELAPDSARHIFEYLSAFPITEKRFDGLIKVLNQLGGVYADIDLLAHEYLCNAPSRMSRALRNRIVDWALSQFVTTFSGSPRLAASACMTLGKFGTDAALDELANRFRRDLRLDSVARQQALVVLAGSGRLSRDEVAAVSPLVDPISAQHIRYLLELMAGEEKAVGMAMSLIEPLQRRSPDRWVVRTRALFLAPVVARAAPARWKAIQPKWLSRIGTNSPRYADREVERWLTIV